MADWQPIETAPRDGTTFLARIPGHGEDNLISFQWGLVNREGHDCGSWTLMSEQEPPEDWTDGWCWEENEDGLPSTQPTHWKPAPHPRGGLIP
jgi:hypothetical protein